MYYARCDTHYLLYVYDNMRNDLITRSDQDKPEENLIAYALQKSKETSMDRYSSYVADPDSGDGNRGWINALTRSNIRLDGPQFAVYRAVHKWRDDLARTEDEGPFFIMPQQTLMEIARLLPVDPKALHSILGGRCASVVQRSLSELFAVISKAKEEGQTGPSSVEFLRRTLTDNSLSAVAEREFEQSKRPKPELPPVEVLRAEKSQLFGEMAISSLWETSAQATKGDAGKLISLPWTTYIHDAMVASAQQEAEAKYKKEQEELDMIPLESTPKAPVPRPEVDNTEFTLRQGRKRKVEDVKAEEVDSDDGGGAALSQDVIPLHDEEETKAERKERKRAAKRAKRTARAEQNGQKPQRTSKAKRMPAEGDEEEDGEEEEGEVDEEAPFDYSNAQSVLHAQRAMMGASQEGKGKKKAFDPYAARINADGPKPARRMHGEKAGRSLTFKK